MFPQSATETAGVEEAGALKGGEASSHASRHMPLLLALMEVRHVPAILVAISSDLDKDFFQNGAFVKRGAGNEEQGLGLV